MYADQKQPVRGSGRPGLRSITRRENFRDAIGCPPADADFDQRADKIAHHVSQKSVPLNPHDEGLVETAATTPLDRPNGPLARTNSRACALEGGEVVRADEVCRCCLDAIDIESLRNVPRITNDKRQHERCVDDAILVDLSYRTESGMEIRWDILHQQDSNERPACSSSVVSRSPSTSWSKNGASGQQGIPPTG